MKAIVQNDYKSPDALKVKEVEKPKIKEDEVLVKVIASSVNAGDLFSLNGTPFLVKFFCRISKAKRLYSRMGCSRKNSESWQKYHRIEGR